MPTVAISNGPRLKLERAKHHIEDFIAQAEVFYKRETAGFYIEDNPNTRQRALCIDIDTTVPEHYALIIGDAVHNLRSALDHLTWDLVRPFNPPRPNDVQFPFCRKAESFEGALTHRQVTLAGEEIVEKFRVMKPYPGGDEVLYALHQIDIADKHQLVVPVRSLIGFERLNVRDVDPTAPDLVIEKRSFSNIDKDKRLAVWRYDPRIPFITPPKGKDVDVIIQIMFRKDQPLGGKSVSANLRTLAITVDKAIRSFGS